MGAEQEPEFDPATWTPDKPWSKGYYKPVPGAKAWMAQFDLVGDPGDGFRLFFWLPTGTVSQILGFAAAMAGLQGSYGLLHAIARTFTSWPLLHALFSFVIAALAQ